jgi:hypothetical protein
MTAIAVSQNTKATWLTRLAGVCALALDSARRAMGYAAAMVLIGAAGAALVQLVAEILSFPAPVAVIALTLMAVTLLHQLRRDLCHQPGHRHGPADPRGAAQR